MFLREEEPRAERDCPHKPMLRENVLRKKADFDLLYKKGKSAGDKYVVIFSRENNFGFGRRAFLASKKVGNSVKRNRARRLMKEAFREILNDDEIRKNLENKDIILIARSTIIGQKESAVEKSIRSALKKIGVSEKRN